MGVEFPKKVLRNTLTAPTTNLPNDIDLTINIKNNGKKHKWNMDSDK